MFKALSRGGGDQRQDPGLHDMKLKFTAFQQADMIMKNRAN